MPSKEEEARELAQKHYQIEAGITQILHITGTADAEVSPAEPIKLLEVNKNTVPSGVMPVQFGPNPAAGIHYPSIIIEVTPEEFQRLQTRELSLPSDWTVGDLILRQEEGAAQ